MGPSDAAIDQFYSMNSSSPQPMPMSGSPTMPISPTGNITIVRSGWAGNADEDDDGFGTGGGAYGQENFKTRRWLIETLLQYDQSERRTFLEFCTSCGRLPVGGLKALGMKILPEQPGRTLPRSRACANTLFLPDYPSKEEFQRSLKLALHESHGQFEQE